MSQPTKADLLARRPRTRRVLSDADMERLFGLYYDPSYRVSQVAAAFAVPGSTLLRWIDEMDWPTRRGAGAPARSSGTMLPRTIPHDLQQRGAWPDSAPAKEPIDLDDLRLELAARAQCELAAMPSPTAAMDEDARERNARIIGSLARSIQRLDNSLELHARIAALVTENKRLRRTGPPKPSEMQALLADAQELVRRKLQAQLRKG